MEAYEKVIVAVLACHGEGRCMWKGATAAGGTRGLGSSRRDRRRVQAAVDVAEACSGLSAGSEVTVQTVEGLLRVAAEDEGRCVVCACWVETESHRRCKRVVKQRGRRTSAAAGCLFTGL